MITRIIKDLEKDNTIELLEETGKINIDFIDEELNLLIKALEKITGKKYCIYNEVGGQYLREKRDGKISL